MSTTIGLDIRTAISREPQLRLRRKSMPSCSCGTCVDGSPPACILTRPEPVSVLTST